MLITNVTGAAFGTIVETYSVDVEHRLHVTVDFSNKRIVRSGSIRRVYDASPH